ncbi:MAG: UDP-N-acetylglucosamine--N-acetylmuramyl-(pentapeptide) pyrophosphoryl-undecaprenol N-acetylglucosamine transferase [Alphaproteobacteria bacterium]|nr:UDP-N-acetylglucosamine--N-acetylmuramyl-(pentapeptide) pyrophosphoryl-undecaprenol N-acetylglucosamine transferase [Alphaproteobacteria bacterium]
MKIWIATGGTGGHVFPALVVAEELVRRHNRVIISTDSRVMDMVKKNKPPRAGIAWVWASGVGAKGKLQQVFALMKIGFSAVALTLRFMVFRPDRVVAFGGYASVPAILAARVWKIPTLLHEQNAAIGRANKFALRWVNTLMTSFPKVEGMDDGRRMTDDGKLKVVYTGLPVRKEFMSSIIHHPSSIIRLLVTGGSLGAQILDDVVPSSIILLPSSIVKKLFIVHQTRPENVARLQRFYAGNSVKANVLSFIHDMASEVAAADLVIGRSGASTVAELQTVGRPAILVPLGINPDQAANAEVFASQGGGIAIPQSKFTSRWLSATLEELFSNGARLKKMAAKAKIENNAVANIAEEILKQS